MKAEICDCLIDNIVTCSAVVTSSNSSFGFFFVFLFIIAIGFVVFNYFQGNYKRGKEKRAIKFAKAHNYTYKPFGGQELKDIDGLDCFSEMNRLSYINVISIPENDHSITIGDLEWVPVTKILAIGNEEKYGDINDMTKDSAMGACRSTNLGILTDDKLNIPDFDLVIESLGVKLIEKLKMNQTTDIDFADDKAFSDSWWLSGKNESKIRKMFDKSTRNLFNSFLKDGYSISGRKNKIYVLTNKTINSNDDYLRLLNNLKTIHRFLKINKVVYIENKEEK